MESFGLLLALFAVGLGSIAFALWPLVRRARAPQHLFVARDGALAERKEVTLAALVQLDRDYAIGNLAPSEYAELRGQLEAHAIRAFKAEDEETRVLEAAIDREVARLRAELREAATPRPPDARPARACAHCGHRLAAVDRFCSLCGAPASPPLSARSDGIPRMTGEIEGSPRPTVHAADIAAPLPRAFSSTSARRHPAPWVGGGVVLAVAVLAGVVWLYRTAPARLPQEPVATLPTASIRALALDSRDPNWLWAASETGLLASADSGRTWQSVRDDGSTAVAVAVSQPGTVYAAGGNVIARSGDRGRSWEVIGEGPPDARVQTLAADPADPNLLYAAAGAALYRSGDGGVSWTLVGSGLPATTTALAVVPGTPGAPPMLLAATMGEGVLASADGGVRWANASGFVTAALPTLAVAALAYDPNSGDRYEGPDGRIFRGALYAGTDRGLFKSTDAGSSWNRLPLEASVQALAVSPTVPGLVVAIDARGQLFRSADRGLTWPGGSS